MIRNFEQTYSSLGFETSYITFFGRTGGNPVRPDDAAAHLLEQDAVVVSGGSPRCAFAVWDDWGIPVALRAAWEHGVLLSGVSAGAVCWFETHVPPGKKATPPPRGFLGFLKGPCAVHYGTRRQQTQETMRSLKLPSVIAIDDDVAILYEGPSIAKIASWRDGATAYCLEYGTAGIKEIPLICEVIDSFAPRSLRQPTIVGIESKRACIGCYELIQRLQVLITLEGDQLFAQHGTQGKLPIFPQGDDTYFWMEIDAEVAFKRGRNGEVTSFVHRQNGRSSDGIKVASC